MYERIKTVKRKQHSFALAADRYQTEIGRDRLQKLNPEQR
jgi:hypothetical protein